MLDGVFFFLLLPRCPKYAEGMDLELPRAKRVPDEGVAG